MWNSKKNFWETRVKKKREKEKKKSFLSVLSVSCDRECPCPLVMHRQHCQDSSSERIFVSGCLKLVFDPFITQKSNYRLPHGAHLTICIYRIASSRHEKGQKITVQESLHLFLSFVLYLYRSFSS